MMWCRDFPSHQQALQLANLAGQSGTKLSVYGDDAGCPGQAANCRQWVDVNPGDELIVNQVADGWACVWYQRTKDAVVGWVKSDKLVFQHADSGKDVESWIGMWKYSLDVITISSKDGRSLNVEGRASWQGPIIRGESVLHFGAISGDVTPSNNHAHFSDTDGCTADFSRIGRYLVVADNGHCGGMNVSFRGVYLKTR
jgi:hypothetical protein